MTKEPGRPPPRRGKQRDDRPADPVRGFTATLAKLRALGQVVMEQTDAEDVTAEYVDVDDAARLASAKLLEKRLLELAAGAARGAQGFPSARSRAHARPRLVLARDSEPGEPARGHVVVPEPNRRIAADLTTVWTRRDGVVALVPTIDCGDRTAVIEVTKDQHGPAVLASLEAKLVAAFGEPENVPDGVELRRDHAGADCAAL